MNLSNNKGAVLIAVYMALFVLVTLSSSVALFNFTELNDARRHQDMTKAFWLAEGGINQFLADTTILNEIEVLDSVIPEPASIMVFAGLALCFGSAAWWRRRKRVV